jgi:predicted esterase
MGGRAVRAPAEHVFTEQCLLRNVKRFIMRSVISFLLVLLFALAISAQEKPKFSAKTTKVEADPEKGFSYPYYLFTPSSFYSKKDKTHTILVVPNNTGKTDDDLGFHEKNVKRKIFQAAFVFNKLEVAVLIPVFPRPEKDWKIYTHALDRDSMTTDEKEYKRFDLQLAAMIDHAREKLKEENIETEKKVLIHGYSASGMFTNRFTFLHPERVKAATIGSPGGWAIAPVKSFKGKTLPYPIGIGDYKKVSGREFNLEELRKVPLFIYLGGKDDNDSVVFRDGYEKEDETLIFELFGKTPSGRWEISRKLYKDQKLNAVFKLYPDVKHTISKEMRTDLLEFLSKYKN